MKKLIIALLLASSSAYAWDTPAMNAQVNQTNFFVNENCSATLIDAAHGYLLTANHCISGQFTTVEKEDVSADGTVTKKRVRVSVPGSVSQIRYVAGEPSEQLSFNFRVVKNSDDLDLAVIKTTGPLPNLTQATLSCSIPVRGDVSYSVGNPRGFYSTVAKGNISSVERTYRALGYDKDRGLVQTTSPIGGGSSGGALYNDVGELIGVVVMGYQAISPVGFAVPLWDIQEFVKDIPNLSTKVCP